MGLFDRILGLGRAGRDDSTVENAGGGFARERAPAPRFRSPDGEDSGPEIEAQAKPDVESPAASEPEEATRPEERELPPGEFAVFLSDMGATPVSPEESALALRDATIAELRSSLAALRPLGDRLAEVEKVRMGLEAELDEARLEVERLTEEHQAEVAALSEEHDRLVRNSTRLEERVEKLRAKFNKRDRVATERWHQMRALQQERRELKAELKEARRSPVDLANGRPPGRSSDLATLFGSEANDAVPDPPVAPDESRPMRS